MLRGGGSRMAPVAVTIAHPGMAYAGPSVPSISVSPETAAIATRPAQRSCAGAPWWSPGSSNRQAAVERIKRTASIAKKLAAAPAVRHGRFIPRIESATFGPDGCRATRRKYCCPHCMRPGQRGGGTSRCGVGASRQLWRERKSGGSGEVQETANQPGACWRAALLRIACPTFGSPVARPTRGRDVPQCPRDSPEGAGPP